MAIPSNTNDTLATESVDSVKPAGASIHPLIEEALWNSDKECQNRQDIAIKPESVTSVRTPIHRCKAKAQTVYITTGYGWRQTKETVVIYLTIQNAIHITQDQYHLEVESRSVQLTIGDHEGANYDFRISNLNGEVIPEKSMLKNSVVHMQFRESKVVMHLFKASAGREWTDVRLKTTRDVYDQLQREQGAPQPLSRSQVFDTFDIPPVCGGHCSHNRS